MSVVKRIIALMDDYYLANNREYPRRITVSREVARELDAEIAARSENINGKLEAGPPRKLRMGSGVTIREVLLVADMDSKYIVDVR